jgi:acyl carrier protein
MGCGTRWSAAASGPAERGCFASSTPLSPGKLTIGWPSVLLPGISGESDVTQEQISQFCIASLANVLRISKDSVETGTKFNRLGLDSAMVVYLMMELEEGLGLELSPDDFYDYPTVNELSHDLAERLARRSAA